MSFVVTKERNVMVNSDEFISQKIWLYRQGVIETNVIITRFNCMVHINCVCACSVFFM
jgi:hypothetical protein